ncbi:hypothetical protein Asppvi_006952 [Aspergillus pseudoviridinutans]|uniref:Uncharacterized protein n=1 Tax=Aspergillus pseudoviridinutans TaxID=1517512 RepID=A0A9P3BB15_9EURO|nr:uncharacterized protein Asppvi_006952 [Aspergillus pseudoviridinutans]GIJ88036.1 hypothetical protein Asppvi_006952 [Aspergillus pseudoviridinutans]
MAKSHIKPFHGRRDGSEDPEAYLEDIEYEIKLEKRHMDDADYVGMTTDESYSAKTSETKLRSGTTSYVGTTKNDWDQLKQEFTKKYRVNEVDATTRRFQVSPRSLDLQVLRNPRYYQVMEHRQESGASLTPRC